MSTQPRSQFVTAALAVISFAVSSAAQAQVGFTNGFGLNPPHSTVTFGEVAVSPTTPVTNQFGAFGVTFSPGLYMLGGPSWTPGITGFWLANINPTPFGPELVDPFSIFFTAPVTNAAFGWSNQTGNLVASTFTAFLHGTQVAQYTRVQSHTWNPDSAYVGFNSTLGAMFDEIRVSTSTVAWLPPNETSYPSAVRNYPSPVWIDNVQFSTAPEPASIVLLGTGLVGVLGIAQRRTIRQERRSERPAPPETP